MNDNLILIGMPGAGKSTVGVVLAKILGYHFIDSDLCIQEQEGRLLWEIIRDEGIDGFNRIEEQVNSRICASRSVIATGGSVVYGAKAMEHLKQIGTVIYLKIDYAVLSDRLGNLTRRGVVLRPGQSLESLFAERAPLYEKYADLTVKAGTQSVQETAEKIAGNVQSLRRPL